MTRDEIIRMAREAGFSEWSVQTPQDLERFAALVAAAERKKFTIHAAALVRDARQDAIERERDRRAFELAESYRCGYELGVLAEREACAKLCEDKVGRSAGYGGQFEGYGKLIGERPGSECAAAIRARGEK